MLVFKHEGLIAFIGRLTHDREFCEWFVARPADALASHGLASGDLRDLIAVLRADHHRREVAEALEPTVQAMLDLVDRGDCDDEQGQTDERLASFDLELRATRERLAVVRSRRRPWWNFWS
ncbi:MAG: hypothetical protein ACRDIY_21890 [Chloroflexota bacterium]